jgi:hypothetical protein
VRVDDLVHHYPRLFHMAACGSWPSIRARGLLTTRQMVDACDPGPDVREAVLGRRREDSVLLTHPVHGDVVIRDQSPLRAHILDASLTDMTVRQWLDVLNDRVFFWLHPDRLGELLRARRYRDAEHDVLTVDTASLVAAHRDRIRLSALNSGATLYPNAPPRGSGTFRTIGDYPWRPRRTRGPKDGIAELAVLGGVPDVDAHVVRVERRHRDTVVEVLDDRT